MDILKTRNYSKTKQYLISILLIIVTTVICFFSVNFIGYRAVALILLLVVSLNAILFDIFPVLLSALLSALIWNFLFIPPIFTFHIDNAEDALMFLMYFVIALINTILTSKIREFQQKAKEKEDKEKSIKLYNTLLNSLSHEFRTPISTIIGAIDTIKDTGTALTELNKKELYSEIEKAGLRLNRQVENLLNMGRLEAGILKGKPDWCDINELIFSVVEREKEKAEKHTIIYNAYENPPLYKLDSGFMEQILHNIIDNALQHTPNTTTVEIEAINDEYFCKIAISDNGIGFPESEINMVFDRFYRLNNITKGGTGLGLSIVKGFVEAQNGTINLKNNEKGGATFTIEIPAETTYINNLKNE